jgi:hypothetical protein
VARMHPNELVRLSWLSLCTVPLHGGDIPTQARRNGPISSRGLSLSRTVAILLSPYRIAAWSRSARSLRSPCSCTVQIIPREHADAYRSPETGGSGGAWIQRTVDLPNHVAAHTTRRQGKGGPTVKRTHPSVLVLFRSPSRPCAMEGDTRGRGAVFSTALSERTVGDVHVHTRK